MGAFEALFRQYERLVFSNAYLMTGSRQEAEDISPGWSASIVINHRLRESATIEIISIILSGFGCLMHYRKADNRIDYILPST